MPSPHAIAGCEAYGAPWRAKLAIRLYLPVDGVDLPGNYPAAAAEIASFVNSCRLLEMLGSAPIDSEAIAAMDDVGQRLAVCNGDDAPALLTALHDAADYYRVLIV